MYTRTFGEDGRGQPWHTSERAVWTCIVLDMRKGCGQTRQLYQVKVLPDTKL